MLVDTFFEWLKSDHFRVDIRLISHGMEASLMGPYIVAWPIRTYVASGG